MIEYKIQSKRKSTNVWYFASRPFGGRYVPKTLDEAQEDMKRLKTEWEKVKEFAENNGRSTSHVPIAFRIVQREVTEWREVNGE